MLRGEGTIEKFEVLLAAIVSVIRFGEDPSASGYIPRLDPGLSPALWRNPDSNTTMDCHLTSKRAVDNHYS
jgi:hypothetical protein